MTSKEDSIGQAFDINIQNIFITGDFNLDILKDNSNKTIQSKTINNPTNFTQSSSTIIDLCLTANNNTVLSGIRYHSPIIYCVLNFNKTKNSLYAKKIFLYNRGNYEAFKDD